MSGSQKFNVGDRVRLTTLVYVDDTAGRTGYVVSVDPFNPLCYGVHWFGAAVARSPGYFNNELEPAPVDLTPGAENYTEPLSAVTEGEDAGDGYTTKDSGQREEFSTGSKRDTRTGKGRYDLLPPDAIRRVAQLYERGASKYGDRNWELGQPQTRFADSMLRHAFQAADGQTDEDHLAAVIFNAAAMISQDERIIRGDLPATLNDLPARP